MEIPLPHLPKENHSLSKWCADIWRYLRRKNLCSSSDILVTETTVGTTLTLRKQINQPNIFTLPAPVAAPIGGNFAGDYNSSSSYAGGATVFAPTTIIYSNGISNVTVIPGYYGLYPGLTASANPVNLNEVPQFPAPTTGSVCWRFLCPALNLVSVCSNGGANVYVASTGTF